MFLKDQLMKTKKLDRCMFCDANDPLMLHQTENFYFSIDLSPLLSGHLIICSKQHFFCAGEITANLFSELIKIKNEIRFYLKKIYGQVVFFEHGRAGHCVMKGVEERLCQHFHLHALPAFKDISGELDKQFSSLTLNSYEEISDFYNRFGEYLYYEDNNGKMHFYPVYREIPPHFLRTMIAKTHGFAERADWMKNSDYQLIEHTKKDLSCLSNMEIQCAMR